MRITIFRPWAFLPKPHALRLLDLMFKGNTEKQCDYNSMPVTLTTSMNVNWLITYVGGVTNITQL